LLVLGTGIVYSARAHRAPSLLLVFHNHTTLPLREAAVGGESERWRCWWWCSTGEGRSEAGETAEQTDDQAKRGSCRAHAGWGAVVYDISAKAAQPHREAPYLASAVTLSEFLAERSSEHCAAPRENAWKLCCSRRYQFPRHQRAGPSPSRDSKGTALASVIYIPTSTKSPTISANTRGRSCRLNSPLPSLAHSNIALKHRTDHSPKPHRLPSA
jgi:hypothetical protein